MVLTHNEALNLGRLLASVRGWCDDVVIVDSGSTDGTARIAEQYAARVVHHPFETHARQWGWALEQLELRHCWVLGLDADQRVTPELRREIEALFASQAGRIAACDGFYIKRRQVFRNRWIRHGGYYPKYLLKLFRRDQVRTDPADLVDHHFAVGARVGRLEHDIIEENLKENDIAFWIEKHLRYARLLAREETCGVRGGARDGNADAYAGRNLRLRRIWSRLPLYVRPILYFLYRYFLRLGFLDGKEGFVFHFLHALWFRLMVDIQVDELRREGRVGRQGLPGSSGSCRITGVVGVAAAFASPGGVQSFNRKPKACAP